MDSVLECLPRGSRVAILRLRSLGDCVLTTPALDILKRSRPDLRLAIFVEDRFREIFEGNPDLAEIHAARTARRCAASARSSASTLHGGTRSAWMTELSGARYRAGFRHYRQQFVYNVRIPRAQEILHVDRKVHTAEHLASAIFFLGAPVVEIPRAKLVRCAAATPLSPIPEPLSSTPSRPLPEKTWPAANFLAVADHLAQAGVLARFHRRRAPTISHRSAATARCRHRSPSSKSLLASAALFVGNDSGPAHMAAAFGVPSVVIFGPSDPAIWGPWRTTGEV